jgi:hypothetical protein
LATTASARITRDEIYHRLEWFFDPRHNPAGPHRIPPSVPLEKFSSGVDPSTAREMLWASLKRASSTYTPAWRSPLFHGVQLPWESTPPLQGVRDAKVFGDLITRYAQAYMHAGWSVT